MIKWLIKTLQKFDKDTYQPDEKLPDPNRVHEKELPHIEITGFEINPDNPKEGAFAFEWNQAFILQLRTEGFQGKNDEEVVDNWFASVCKNIVMETYQQEMARIDDLPDNPNLVQRRKVDDNRNEYF